MTRLHTAGGLVLAVALLGCAGGTPPEPVVPPTPVASASPSPGGPGLRVVCPPSTGPISVPVGASVAVVANDAEEIWLYATDDRTGCWNKLDDSRLPPAFSSLAFHPSGRWVFASGSVASGKAGVAAYRVAAEHGLLDGIGSNWMGQQASDHAGSVVASEDAVYMLSGGPSTGRHGGFWYWAFDRAEEGLSWRGSPHPARDPYFLLASPAHDLIYLGTETLDESFGNAAVALSVGFRGALTATAQTTDIGRAPAVVDPSGTFFWIVAWPAGRIDAYREAPDGALRARQRGPWAGRLPAAHPTGRVLYTATPTHVQAYAVDPATGLPGQSAVASLAYAAGDRAVVAVHPAGGFVYVLSREEVRRFRTDASGSLEDLGRVADGGLRFALARLLE